MGIFGEDAGCCPADASVVSCPVMDINERKTIVVGLSGGVDSAVAADLLLREGHRVIGAFMKNWSDTPDPVTGECGWKAERRDAMRAAAVLGVPFYTFDLEEAYRERVVGYLVREYAAGRTPNPDVLCNREIKFDLFMKEAFALGADMVATGHYARIGTAPDGSFTLLAGKDTNKDQSYFLHQLSQERLSRIIFPIGDLTKPEVRRIAAGSGLPNAAKKDSQGICFVGKVDLKAFLSDRAPGRPGPVVSVDGEVLGVHQGIAPYTIGQRHGLGIGGGTPCFVVEKDMRRNTLVVARGEDPEALYATGADIEDMHWISGTVPELPLRCQARIRYRQPLQDAVLEQDSAGLHLMFADAQRAVSPGQFAVLYDDDRCIGGGVIAAALTGR